jgi:hypothetical protein
VIRSIVAGILLGLLLELAWGSSGRVLSLASARALVASRGVNVGTVFLAGGQRYAISAVSAHSPAPNVFDVRVRVRPVP